MRRRKPTKMLASALSHVHRHPMTAFCCICCFVSATISIYQMYLGPLALPNEQMPVVNFTNEIYITTRRESTCSARATKRGPWQKVVSYACNFNSTDNNEYSMNIERHIALVKKFYPGWLMRVYYDLTDLATTQALFDLQRRNRDVLNLCFVGNLPGYGNILGRKSAWRFLTLADPLVDVTIFRDLSSTILPRELAAVNQWMESGYPMHVMRDHPEHSSLSVPGALWGVKLNTGQRESWRLMINDMMTVLQSSKNDTVSSFEQAPLEETVWRLALKEKDFVMQHDSYSCTNERFLEAGGMHPFPTCREQVRKNVPNFVGAKLNSETPINMICPEQCRACLNCTLC